MYSNIKNQTLLIFRSLWTDGMVQKVRKLKLLFPTFLQMWHQSNLNGTDKGKEEVLQVRKKQHAPLS